MSDREQNRRENDSLQSSEVDPALGQDERSFGAGGQTVQRPITGNDERDRDPHRDASLPAAAAEQELQGRG
jgi:hypothetical protein